MNGPARHRDSEISAEAIGAESRNSLHAARIDGSERHRRRVSGPTPSPLNQATQVSAGGVVVKRVNGIPWVCLIAKNGGRTWALPKGRLDVDESPEHAAVREVLEETGHRARVMVRIGEVNYEFTWKANRTHYHKTVTFFLMSLLEENAQARDLEADAAEWFDVDDASMRLTHDNEREVVELARDLLARGVDVE